jgi:hypothetical protein
MSAIRRHLSSTGLCLLVVLNLGGKTMAADAPAPPAAGTATAVTTNAPTATRESATVKESTTPTNKPPVTVSTMRVIYGGLDDGTVITMVAGPEKIGLKAPHGYRVQAGAGGSVTVQSMNPGAMAAIQITFEYASQQAMTPEALQARVQSRFPGAALTGPHDISALDGSAPLFHLRIVRSGTDALTGMAATIPRAEGYVLVTAVTPKAEERDAFNAFNNLVSSLRLPGLDGKITYPKPSPFL